MKDVTIISQSRQKVGNVDVTFTVGKVNPTPATPTTGAKPGMALPLGASLNKDDREEIVRGLARLQAAMPKVVGR